LQVEFIKKLFFAFRFAQRIRKFKPENWRFREIVFDLGEIIEVLDQTKRKVKPILTQTENHSDNYDRQAGQLEGLPDCIKTLPSTIRNVQAMSLNAQTYIVQTVRQKDIGDHIFLESVTRNGTVRIVLPPKVADAIARQRDALTARSRSKAAKRVAQERMEAGIKPAFLNGRKKTKKKGGGK
jgi:hypothetical protein